MSREKWVQIKLNNNLVLSFQSNASGSINKKATKLFKNKTHVIGKIFKVRGTAFVIYPYGRIDELRAVSTTNAELYC